MSSEQYALGNSFVDGNQNDKPVIDWSKPVDGTTPFFSLSRFDR